jgi:hypothetical protein
MRFGQEFLIAADGLDHPAGRVREDHPGAAAVAHRGHPTGAEDLAAHVVAVGGLEAGLGDADGAVVEAHHHHHHGGVEQAAVAPVGFDQCVRGGVHLCRLGARVEEPERVGVVDQGLVEDRVRVAAIAQSASARVSAIGFS